MAKKKNLDYQDMERQNTEAFLEQLKIVDPNLYVLRNVLEETGVNYYTIFQYIRQLYNVAIGSGWGRVSTILQDGKVKYIEGTDVKKIEEPIITPKQVDNL